MEVQLDTQYISADSRMLFATKEVKYGLEVWKIYQMVKMKNGSVKKIEIRSRWSEEDIKTQLFIEVNRKDVK